MQKIKIVMHCHTRHLIIKIAIYDAKISNFFEGVPKVLKYIDAFQRTGTIFTVIVKTDIPAVNIFAFFSISAELSLSYRKHKHFLTTFLRAVMLLGLSL